MKYYISYFYQVRNMKPHMLPISTAAFDPKWWKTGFDKNGVMNGFRIPELIMPEEYLKNIPKEEMCSKDCKLGYSPCHIKKQCAFEQAYYSYLNTLDFKYLLYRLDFKAELASRTHNIDTIILLVHEPPNRYCAERPVLQKWFEENGIELKEWSPDQKE